MSKHIVVVGGGFAGITVAKKLKGPDFRITIIDKSNHHLFQPLLYQVATAALSPGDIAVPIRAVFSKRQNVRVILGKVTSVDTDKQLVHLQEGDEIAYDYLVMAPGAQYNYFGNDQWSEHAPGLKTLDNALSIRERILLSLEKAEKIEDPEKRQPYLTYVVIGGGPTGVEMAGSIAEIAKRNMMRDYRNFDPNETKVYLVEAIDQILNGFPENLSESAKTTLEGMGVEVLTGSPVKDIRKNGVQLSDRFIETPNIMWAAGVSASPVLNTLNTEQDRIGRVMVNPDLSIPSASNVFVLGDAAHAKDKQGNPLPGLAPVALQQGKYIADMLKKEAKGQPRTPFRYIDKGSMATIGRAKAVANIRGFTFSGLFAWMLWGLIHVFFLIGYRNRFRVFAEWVWHYITFKRGVRLIAKKDVEEAGVSEDPVKDLEMV